MVGREETMARKQIGLQNRVWEEDTPQVWKREKGRPHTRHHRHEEPALGRQITMIFGLENQRSLVFWVLILSEA